MMTATFEVELEDKVDGALLGPPAQGSVVTYRLPDDAYCEQTSEITRLRTGGGVARLAVVSCGLIATKTRSSRKRSARGGSMQWIFASATFTGNPDSEPSRTVGHRKGKNEIVVFLEEGLRWKAQAKLQPF